MTPDEQKRATGEAAAALVWPGMTVGLGTGTTARWFVSALAARKIDVTCVATSRETEQQADSLGLRRVELDEAGPIDLTVDGADQIGPGLALIKGGGGALLREKLVWEASKRCVVIADASKNQPPFGAFPLPVEVVRFGHESTLRRIVDVLKDQGVDAVPQLRGGVAAPYITDNGNLIYDIPCGAITDPGALAAALKTITGLVEHGLFLGLASEALIGTERGVERLTAAG
jgi:ribose 5-phosphate isomerase A